MRTLSKAASRSEIPAGTGHALEVQPGCCPVRLADARAAVET